MNLEIENPEYGPKVVILGGGTGLSILLRGLKKFTSNITAIVTVADDGGGSGILREDLGMLPPGDIRSCLLALANVEPTLEKLLKYRFKDGNLKGQSFGNLFIAAMNGIYGNFEAAVKEMNNVLAVTGQVLPMTNVDVKLFARLENGMLLEGESIIPVMSKKYGSKIDYVYMKPKDCNPVDESITAIDEADIIVLGPGSLYTSIIPNLLVKNIPKYISNSKALKIYIPNIMTQPGETEGYNVLDHVNEIIKHTNDIMIDYVVVNTEKIPDEISEKYKKDGAYPVYVSDKEEKALKGLNIKIIKEDLLEVKKNYIRHDAIKVSKSIISLLNNVEKAIFK